MGYPNLDKILAGMNDIDLQYIGAKTLTQNLACCETLEDLKKELEWQLHSDFEKINGYIEKYDNKFDKAEGTNVEPLKEQLAKIQELLNKLV
jgi:hypothetical protein